MGRKFVNRLRTFPLFLTNIYELIHEHLRTLRFVYELWDSFTNLRFRLRTLGFIYELACYVYELWVLLRKFVNRSQTCIFAFTNFHFCVHLRTCMLRLRTFPFANLGLIDEFGWVWGFLDGILGPFANIDLLAYIHEFWFDRRTLGSIDKFCRLFSGETGILTNFWEEHGKTSNSMQTINKNFCHIGLLSKMVARNELFEGEFAMWLINLRWRTWGLKD